jgi:membrane protease YdiL (CAAX protease family)
MTVEILSTPTKPNWWKLSFAVFSILALGVLAKAPSVILVENLADKPQVWGRVTGLLFIEQFVIFGVIPAGLGLFLIPRLGIKLPLFENWAGGAGHSIDTRKVLRDSLIFALVLAVVGVMVQTLIKRDLNALGLGVGASPHTTWWSMLLLAFSAGVVEEIVFRLGLLTIVAAVVNVIWKPRSSYLKSGAFWLANIITALFFSAAHFLNYSSLQVPLTFGLIWKTIAGNSLAAAAFGWLYWKRGLVSAMLAHFILDVCIYVIAPAVFMIF